MSLHEISLDEGLDKLQRVFVENGMVMPEITLVSDSGDRVSISSDTKATDIKITDNEWAAKALVDFANDISLVLGKMPDLLKVFIKDGGNFEIGNGHKDFLTSGYGRGVLENIDEAGEEIAPPTRAFVIRLKASQLSEIGNVTQHELAHHVDVANKDGYRHNQTLLFQSCFKYDKYFHEGASAAKAIDGVRASRNYSEKDWQENFAIILERICSANPDNSRLLKAYTEVIRTDLEYQMQQNIFVLDRVTDMVAREIHFFDFSSETTDLMMGFTENKMFSLTSDTDVNAAKIYREKAEKLQAELEPLMVKEVYEFVRELRANLGLPAKEFEAQGEKPQAARHR